MFVLNKSFKYLKILPIQIYVNHVSGFKCGYFKVHFGAILCYFLTVINHTIQLYKVGEIVVHTGIPFYETPIRSFILKNLNLDNLETFNFFNHRSWLL